MSKGEVEARTPILDEVGVSHAKDEKTLYTSLSTLDVGDLLSEGEIEGLVKGEHHFAGNAGEIGYQTYEFKPYTALDKDGSCSEKLGYLRSIYWNETPVVDKNGFYNFQEVNVEWTEGTPQGKLPALNPNLPNDKNLKGEEGFELTLFRSIGERLFGPSIELGEGKTPGYYHGGDGAPIWLGNGARNSPIILGDIDRNAKMYTVSNKECVAVRVNIKVTKLLESIVDDQKDNIKVIDGDEDSRGFFAQPEGTAKKGRQQEYGGGDMRARKIKYQIYVRPTFDTKNFKGKQGGSRTDNSDEDLFIPWPKKPVVEDEIFGRIEEPYIRSIEIALSNSERDGARKDYFLGWEIKIVRLTPDSFHTFLKNDSYVDSIVEVYDSKLRYPYCAMVYSRFSAEFFSRIPSRHYDTKLLKVKIPNNYKPLLRKYDESSGFWDGCFKAEKEWTNNPAWCFYDLLTNNRYGLGDYIDSRFVDKWTLYDIAKYCDVLVSDGKGGLEPRFTLNHIITSREEAYKVVNDLASAFRSIAYYAFGNIYVSQDRPKDPIYHFNTSNAIDGIFTYTSSAKKARHTVAIVRYSDKNNLYKPAISYTEDQAGIQRYGIREVETSAIGCTSKAQAKRFGEWILKSEILETESISFSAGQEGMYIRPGDVISVYDEFRNDKKMAGRTLQVQKLGSGIIPSGAIPSYINPPPPSIHPGTNDYYVTGNSIIIDKAIDFTADKEYKLDILTPAGYLEPTQITPSDCEETVTITELTEFDYIKEKSSSTRLDFTNNKWTEGGYFSFLNRINPTEAITYPESRGDFAELTAGGDGHSFINEHTITVDSSRSQIEFLFRPIQSYLPYPTKEIVSKWAVMQRFEVSYVADGKTYYLPLGDTGDPDGTDQAVIDETATSTAKLFQFKEVSDEDYDKGKFVDFSYYMGSKYLPAVETPSDPQGTDRLSDQHTGGKDVFHGQFRNVDPPPYGRTHGDIFECLKWYEANGSADESTAATRELEFVNKHIKETFNSGPLREDNRIANKFITFEKPAGITSLTIKVFSPINGTSTSKSENPLGISLEALKEENNKTAYNAVFNSYKIGLKRTHLWAKTTERSTVENVTVKSTNTDKSLTSADVPEIRRSQIQTIYFSGFQAVTHTGNFSSDYSIGGSGIVTQIFTDTQTQKQLDFDNYVITGYNAASVIGELSDDENEYSSDYENISGADLVWSIEPRTNDMTLNRDYTLDPEFASGHAQQYKVININENESKYDITALEHTPVKYDNLGEDDPGEEESDTVPGGPPENPSMEQDSTENPNPGVKGACCVEDTRLQTRILALGNWTHATAVGNLQFRKGMMMPPNPNSAQIKEYNKFYAAYPDYVRGGINDGESQKYGRQCYNDETEDYCDSLANDIYVSKFYADEKCADIDCKSPTEPTEIEVKPNLPKEEDDELETNFINLNFKIAADFTSISHFKGEDTNKYKLKMFTDQEAYDKNLMGVQGASKEVALGKYYDHLGCINLSPSCSDRNLESDDCYTEQYAEKVRQYGSNFVICKTAVFEGSTLNDSFKSLTDDECSKAKNKSKNKIDVGNKPIAPVDAW